MIKPGDITNQMAATCWIYARGEGESMKWSISEILNAAIEAGIVSPPCYCVRWNGELQKHENMVKLYPGKPWAHDTEHWKGQN